MEHHATIQNPWTGETIETYMNRFPPANDESGYSPGPLRRFQDFSGGTAMPVRAEVLAPGVSVYDSSVLPIDISQAVQARMPEMSPEPEQLKPRSRAMERDFERRTAFGDPPLRR